jgi:S-formylglutathione hydrolase FrmB
MRCDFYSEVLGLSTSMTVLLPQQTSSQIGMSGSAPQGDPSVLYLLHGLSDDDTIWLRRTSIERYVAPLGLAVVMPQVGRSFYADEEHGNRYWTFLSEELPRLCHEFFRLSARREDTFVAGLSMGGYGALKWALRDPGRFAAAASLSGALDVAARRSGTPSSASARWPAATTTPSPCSTRRRAPTCPRSTSPAAPRTSCTRTT